MLLWNFNCIWGNVVIIKIELVDIFGPSLLLCRRLFLRRETSPQHVLVSSIWRDMVTFSTRTIDTDLSWDRSWALRDFLKVLHRRLGVLRGHDHSVMWIVIVHLSSSQQIIAVWWLTAKLIVAESFLAFYPWVSLTLIAVNWGFASAKIRLWLLLLKGWVKHWHNHTIAWFQCASLSSLRFLLNFLSQRHLLSVILLHGGP